jgi:hypothetical protein
MNSFGNMKWREMRAGLHDVIEKACDQILALFDQELRTTPTINIKTILSLKRPSMMG